MTPTPRGLVRFARWDLPVVVALAAIFLASSVEVGDDAGPDVPGLDKAVHFAAYAGLGWCVHRALGAPGRIASPWAATLLAVIVCAAYGASDEFHQGFVSGRVPDPHDVVADTLGAFAAAAWRSRTILRSSSEKDSP